MCNAPLFLQRICIKMNTSSRRSDSKENKIDVKGFIQICIVVEDIEKALDRWTALFQIERPDIQITKPSRSSDLTYRGEIAEYGMKMAVMRADGFVIELVEPDENPSTFREFLKKHGCGVHHLGFEVGDRRDAIVRELEDKEGFEMRTIGYYPGSSWTVVDSEDALGVNINIKPKR